MPNPSPRKPAARTRGPNSHSDPLQRNVQAVYKLDQELREHRSLFGRAGDAIARYAGSPAFILFHILWFGAWIAYNTGAIHAGHPFDPYPFTFLTLIVSLEAIFLTAFVLMSQNRLSREEERRARLEFQINLLAEQESTQTLRLLHRMAIHLGLAPEEIEPATRELEKETAPEQVVKELDRTEQEDHERRTGAGSRGPGRQRPKLRP